MKKTDPPRWSQLTPDALRRAARQIRRKAMPGVDKVSAKAYLDDLEARIPNLWRRLNAGCYQPKPLLEMRIPKGPGETRRIQVPTTEDKIVQRAVLNIIQPAFEDRFLSCSYGSRPGRSAHHAVAKISRYLQRWGAEGLGVVSADFRFFFDTIGHQDLLAFLRQEVSDVKLLALIKRWFVAGETTPGVGISQGGIISPFLANVFLDSVLDRWLLKSYAKGRGTQTRLIRYVDDFVVLVQGPVDSSYFSALPTDLEQRLRSFGLALHPEKTTKTVLAPGDDSYMEALGFRFRTRPSRAGHVRAVAETAPARLSRAVEGWVIWLKKSQRLPDSDRVRVLKSVIDGHVSYYGIKGNDFRVKSFLDSAQRLLRKHSPHLDEVAAHIASERGVLGVQRNRIARERSGSFPPKT